MITRRQIEEEQERRIKFYSKEMETYKKYYGIYLQEKLNKKESIKFDSWDNDDYINIAIHGTTKTSNKENVVILSFNDWYYQLD